MAQNMPADLKGSIRTLSLSYDADEPLPSILKIISTLLPDWCHNDAKVDVVRLTGGVNNTVRRPCNCEIWLISSKLYKAMNILPGLSKFDLDNGAVLIRVYGESTDVLIDRERRFYQLNKQHSDY